MSVIEKNVYSENAACWLQMLQGIIRKIQKRSVTVGRPCKTWVLLAFELYHLLCFVATMVGRVTGTDWTWFVNSGHNPTTLNTNVKFHLLDPKTAGRLIIRFKPYVVALHCTRIRRPIFSSQFCMSAIRNKSFEDVYVSWCRYPQCWIKILIPLT